MVQLLKARNKEKNIRFLFLKQFFLRKVSLKYGKNNSKLSRSEGKLKQSPKCGAFIINLIPCVWGLDSSLFKTLQYWHSRKLPLNVLFWGHVVD